MSVWDLLSEFCGYYITVQRVVEHVTLTLSLSISLLGLFFTLSLCLSLSVSLFFSLCGVCVMVGLAAQ